MRFLILAAVVALAIAAPPNVETEQTQLSNAAAGKNPNAILADKAPLLLSGIDKIFDHVMQLNNTEQTIFRSHCMTILNNPNSILTKSLRKCSVNQKFHNKRMTQIKNAMNSKRANSMQKTSFMKNWFKKTISSCAVKIEDDDLMTYSLELAKLKLESKYQQRQANGGFPLVRNATERAARTKEEASEFLEEMIDEYKETLPEEYQEQLEELGGKLKDDLTEKWDNEWKDLLIEKLNGEWKDKILEQIKYEEAPEQVKNLMSWFAEQAMAKLEESTQDEE